MTGVGILVFEKVDFFFVPCPALCDEQGAAAHFARPW